MSEEIKLLPCPFCGSENITVEWDWCAPLVVGDTTRRWFAECTQCSCQGPFCQKEPEVPKAWNTRAASSEIEQAKADRNRIGAEVRGELLGKVAEAQKENEQLTDLLKRLTTGIIYWGSQEDGIPEELMPAFQEAQNIIRASTTKPAETPSGEGKG